MKDVLNNMEYFLFALAIILIFILLSFFMYMRIKTYGFNKIKITNDYLLFLVPTILFFFISFTLLFGFYYLSNEEIAQEHIIKVILLLSIVFISIFLVYWLLFRLRIEELKMKQIAYTDDLTKLPNRRYLKEYISQMSKRENTFMPFLLLDIDRFKTINDSLGHLVGDELIQQIGKRLVNCVQDKGIVSRLSGDEFIITVSSYTNKDELFDLVQTIIQTIQKPIFIFEHEINITTSVGISIYPQHGHDYETLWKHSDLAIYHAKSLGGNCYIFYSEKFGVSLTRNLMIENDLKKALVQKQLEIYYQPRVDVATGKLNGAEALIRWRHPQRGFISPNEFIPLAEETGLINQIGEWVIQKVCHQIYEWNEKGVSQIPISVNLSAKQFQHKNFIPTLTKIIQQAKIDPKLLELEITERIAMQNTEELIEKLSELKAIGLKILMDDFGTGYSSLSFLGRLPIDTLKIAREFVKDISVKENNAIISTIIAIAHHLNLSVIAEGVETAEQLEVLKELSCNEMQGFFFSKPVPLSKMEDLLISSDHIWKNSNYVS